MVPARPTLRSPASSPRRPRSSSSPSTRCAPITSTPTATIERPRPISTRWRPKGFSSSMPSPRWRPRCRRTCRCSRASIAHQHGVTENRWGRAPFARGRGRAPLGGATAARRRLHHGRVRQRRSGQAGDRHGRGLRRVRGAARLRDEGLAHAGPGHRLARAWSARSRSCSGSISGIPTSPIARRRSGRRRSRATTASTSVIDQRAIDPERLERAFARRRCAVSWRREAARTRAAAGGRSRGGARHAQSLRRRRRRRRSAVGRRSWRRCADAACSIARSSSSPPITASRWASTTGSRTAGSPTTTFRCRSSCGSRPASCGRRCGWPRVTSLVDVLPTVLARFDGEASRRFLEQAEGEDALAGGADRAVGRSRSARVASAPAGRAAASIALVTDRWKLVRRADGAEELYDLAADPGERDRRERREKRTGDRRPAAHARRRAPAARRAASGRRRRTATPRAGRADRGAAQSRLRRRLSRGGLLRRRRRGSSRSRVRCSECSRGRLPGL